MNGEFSEELVNNYFLKLPKLDNLNNNDNIDLEQYKFIENILNSTLPSKHDWVIVQGHYPIHSATKGEHGDSKCLKKLKKLILKYDNVDIYFSGVIIIYYIRIN